MRLFIAALALVAGTVLAHSHQTGEIEVRHPWARATPPGAKVAAGYLEIRNAAAQPDRLVAASTEVAKRVELHVTQSDGDVMRMRQAKSLEIPARSRLELRPSGSHLMLVDIVRPLVKGERFAMRLHFERAGEVEVQVEVQELGARHPRH